ncbi:glycosyltransferase involved in cell wall biosynthesis [Rhodoblastus acidophilus]|uniref:glycosyltransferase n=1 Tax=Rhodoblastus acidophilus TaxID=1074 RepID=UPI00222514A8|nr:glycosyltransferase [Rhodoblastus acidophilus]MCW2284514.1 glycosyltransferase involved in cell wall biosynthesis [Rhodoblastus acidophilus]MCW2333468.1 glycosyltransferase involved in cell wall biosynthesis [Rhodoblastus acidophilus]
MASVDFTVVIPLYNHEAYVGSALDSVLAQTLPAREIIIIDDGSRDDGAVVARKLLKDHPCATVLQQPNAGAHTTINRCIDLATSRFVAVLNSDDEFRPGKLQRCAELFDANPDVDMIFGRVALIDHAGDAIVEGGAVDWLERAHRFLGAAGQLDVALVNENFAVTTSNMVFDKSLWARNGGFQPLRYCHDLDFCFASMRNGVVLYDHEFEHVNYRIHQTNTIKENILKVRVEIACVLAEALANCLLRRNSLDPRILGLLDVALTDKGFGNLLPFLMAKRNCFSTREEFFGWALGDAQVNVLLMDHLERPEDRAVLLYGAEPEGCYHSNRASEAAAARPAAPKTPPLKGGPIVVELSAFDRGGLEKVVLDTSILMKKRGLESIIVSCGRVGALGEVARSHGITVYQLPEQKPLEFYADILRKHAVKLAISHFSRVGYPVFADAGVPNITFIHNVYAFLSGDALKNFGNDDALVNKYISVSSRAKDYAVARLNVAPEKIVTIPNGLIVGEHVARARAATPLTREQFGLNADDYVFLNVASYNLHKNHYLMAAAMKLVLAKTRRIKILCVGNTIFPPHIDALKAYLVENGLESHILMPGHFPEVAPLHAISDAFLLPSLIEGWSIAMNEAMFFGKPLLMTDTGGAADVIEGGDIGILLPNEYGETGALYSELLDDIAYNRRSFRTAAHLAQGMMSFFKNAEHWKRAGKRGHEKILKKYDFSQVVDSYFPIFEAVASERTRK